jgi:hypothetical protein
MTTNSPLPQNPYRYGTKMYSVYQIMQDGGYHLLSEFVPIVKGTYSPDTPANRRTAGSFMRSLRARFAVSHSINLGYRVVGAI